MAGPAILLGVIFKILTVYWGSFLEKGSFPGGLFLVVRSSNEHKLKLYVKAINKTVD